MKVLAALVVAASLLAVASATNVCKGYNVEYTATDIKWADLSIESSLKAVGDYSITLDVSTDGEASFTIEIDSSDAGTLTKTLSVAAENDPNVKTIVEDASLCPTPTPAPKPVAPTVPTTAKCLIVKASAGDYPWIVNAVKKALEPLGVTYTIEPTTGAAGYTWAKLTITTTEAKYATAKAALKPDAYVISYTEVPCSAPAPVAPAVKPTTKCISVKASAGDYPWIVNAVKKALGPLGVTYSIEPATGAAGYTYAKITITATEAKYAEAMAALKPDAYVISYTEVPCSAPAPVAPAVKPTTTCIVVKAAAGDYPWIVNAVKKALGPLGVKYTIAPRSGPAGYTWATITITTTPSTLAKVQAALKPDAYVISYTIGACVAPAPAPKPVAPAVKPTTTCIVVKAAAGDYPWIVNAVKKALGPLGVKYTIAPRSGPAGYTWATITITTTPATLAKVQAALKPDAYVISYTIGACVAPAPAPKPVAPAVKPTTKCISVKAAAGDYPWIVNAVKKALGPLGVKYTIEPATGAAGYTYAKITITATEAKYAEAMAALKPDAYVISYTEVACSAAPVAPAVKPTTTCIVVKAAAGDYPWIVNAVKKALGPLGVKYTIAPRSGPAGYTWATITITTTPSTLAKVQAALKPDAYVISYTIGACVAPAPKPVAPAVKPTTTCIVVKAAAGDYPWIVNAVKKALDPLGVKYTIAPRAGPAGFTWATITITTTPATLAKVQAALKPDAYVISYTVGACVAPAVPPAPLCKPYIVKAKAGDYKWIVNAVNKALTGLPGVSYKLEETTGAAGFSWAKLTVKAPASSWAAVDKALKPDAYVISYTQSGSC